jgi:hypothetical protein
VEKGGPAAAFDMLSGRGFGIEKEPEPGVEMRMRFGTGTEDAFTTTLHSSAAERPSGWPAEIPFFRMWEALSRCSTAQTAASPSSGSRSRTSPSPSGSS